MRSSRFTPRLLIGSLLLAAIGLLSDNARAQAYPSRPVTIIVPYAAGGGTDTVARVLAQSLQRHWSRPVIVENLAGADGVIGTQRALRNPPDGYTLILQLSTILMWKPEKTGGRDLVADMKLLSLIQTAPLSFAVSSSFPGDNMRDFVSVCRKRACSIGTATQYGQLIAMHLMDAAGLKDVVQIPYKGGSPMTTDLLGGSVDMVVASVASAQRYVQAGQMKMLAVGSSQRFPMAPSVPTLEEQGLKVYGDSWYGLMTNKGVPAPVVKAIEDGLKAVSQDPELRNTIETNGGIPLFSTSAEFTAFAAKQRAYLAPLMAKYQLSE